MFREFENVLLGQIDKTDPSPEEEHFGKILMNATGCEQAIAIPLTCHYLIRHGRSPRNSSGYRQARNWIIQALYNQQTEMYRKKENRYDERIVSVYQHDARTVVRGKAGKSTEFVAKISVSMTPDGVTFLERIGWDAFNESLDFKSQVERYRERFDYLPKVVLADQLYGSRANRRFLKEQGFHSAEKR